MPISRRCSPHHTAIKSRRSTTTQTITDCILQITWQYNFDDGGGERRNTLKHNAMAIYVRNSPRSMSRRANILDFRNLSKAHNTLASAWEECREKTLHSLYIIYLYEIDIFRRSTPMDYANLGYRIGWVRLTLPLPSKKTQEQQYSLNMEISPSGY